MSVQVDEHARSQIDHRTGRWLHDTDVLTVRCPTNLLRVGVQVDPVVHRDDPRLRLVLDALRASLESGSHQYRRH